MLENERTPWVV